MTSIVISEDITNHNHQQQVKRDSLDSVKIKNPSIQRDSIVSNRQITIEEKKSFKKFPLHLAAFKGRVDDLRDLLEEADPAVPGFKNKTVLHYACGFRIQQTALEMTKIIFKSPLAQNTAGDAEKKIRLIHSMDHKNQTGLHIAARTRHVDVVQYLLHCGADVNIRDKKNIEPLQLIYKNVPEAMKNLFNKSVSCLEGDPYDGNLRVQLDFSALIGYSNDNSLLGTETKLLAYCLPESEQKPSEILLHPLVKTFLHIKWQKFKFLLWFSILFHVIWLLQYTYFLRDIYLVKCPYEIHTEDCKIGTGIGVIVQLSFLIGFTVIIAGKELPEIYLTRPVTLYMTQVENYGQWIVIGSVVLFSIPVFFRDDENGVILIKSWHYQASALGNLLAWLLILSQIGKIPEFILYVEMLKKVFKSFCKFMFIFSSLLIGFTISFQILMPQKDEFHETPWGFMQVLVMMVGEINYGDIFYGEEAAIKIPFDALTKLILGAFLCVVTIILLNLLIGLTVSDIQGLADNTKVNSLSNQLEQIYLMVKVVISKTFQRFFWHTNIKHLLQMLLVCPPDKDLKLDLQITDIPIELREDIRELAANNQVTEDHDDDFDYSRDDESSI